MNRDKWESKSLLVCMIFHVGENKVMWQKINMSMLSCFSVDNVEGRIWRQVDSSQHHRQFAYRLKVLFLLFVPGLFRHAGLCKNIHCFRALFVPSSHIYEGAGDVRCRIAGSESENILNTWMQPCVSVAYGDVSSSPLRSSQSADSWKAVSSFDDPVPQLFPVLREGVWGLCNQRACLSLSLELPWPSHCLWSLPLSPLQHDYLWATVTHVWLHIYTHTRTQLS